MTSQPTLASRPEARGAEHLAATLRLAAAAWAVLALLQLALFARPSPYGGAYALDWTRYVGHALVYRALTIAVAAAPFALLWLLRFESAVRPRTARIAFGAQIALLAALVALDHVDNELMRFMGTHFSVNLLRTYGTTGALQADVGVALLTDRGGPGLSLALLAAAPALVGWAGLRGWRRTSRGRARAWTRARAGGALALTLAALLAFYLGPGGRFRRERVQGAAIGLVREALRDRVAGERPMDLPALVARHQQRWLEEERAGGWEFARDPEFPLLRVPLAPSEAPASPRWNVIYVQLESFRGWNVGHLNPSSERSATPFLDALARGHDAAWWSRAQSFGAPTISGLMAAHCSVPPHSEFDTTTTFTATRLACFPEVLRRHGWRALFFSASDPDWDNQTVWLRRWYDEIHYWPDADREDRIVFRRAAERIRAAAAAGAPFVATITSISNHYPFASREPALDLTPSREPRAAIRNTMHYTDDVLREFVAALAREPWFAHTLLVVTGDHAFNLGEHEGEAGQRNGYREALWVPLVIAGDHPSLPRGRHDEPASLLDIAPTLAELAGIREPTPWLGHNLAAPLAPSTLVGAERAQMGFAEYGRFSLVLARGGAALHVFDALADPLQRRDLFAQHASEARALADEVAARTRLIDYLLASNRIAPPPAGAAPAARRR
jgi:hypothetical protein